MRLTFEKPAENWIDGLPLGNGITSAMIWGMPACTILSLNHVDFWRDHLGKEVGDYSRTIRQAQRMLLEGRSKEANELLSNHNDMKMMPRGRYPERYPSYNGYTNSFQPIGDLVVEITGDHEFREYNRSLDIETGIAALSYRTPETRIEQEAFIAFENDVLVFCIRSDKPIQGRLRFHRDHQEEYHWNIISAGKDYLSVVGRFDEGVSSGVQATVLTDGPDVRGGQDQVVFESATQVTIYIVVEAGKGEVDRFASCRERMKRVLQTPLDIHRREHIREHAAMFNRSSLQIGSSPRSGPVHACQLVERAVAGTLEPRLVEAIYQTGRYLMMSCNRAGRRPANLQGIWNYHFEPEWDADWHLDMNVEMNHWLCNPTNLDECNLPLFKQMESFIEAGKTLAKKLTGCNGILYYGICGGDGMMGGLTGEAFWTGAAAWIAQHFWTHYEYTLGKGFLREHVYPFHKLVAEFYRDWLVKNNDGYYVTGLSHSPENAPPNGRGSNLHCTMDTALVREVMRHTLEASQILNADPELRPVWQDLHDHVLPYPIGPTGELKEWPAPLQESLAHRHFSHLYPMFPGDEFSFEGTPELMEAAKKAVFLRESVGRGANFGWSYAYLSAMYARLGERKLAHETLHCLVRSVTLGNLLTVACDMHGNDLTAYWAFNVPTLFQVEAGLGATNAIAEMLLQSQGKIIRLLPALPVEWPEGSVRGLKARGAFVVDIEWSGGKLSEGRITSLKGQPCRINSGLLSGSLKITCNGNPIASKTENSITAFATEPGKTYSIKAVG